MSEFSVESRKKRALKIVAVALATVAIPACSNAKSATHSEITPTTQEVAELPLVDYPEVMWGYEYIDVTENASVDCTSAEEASKSGDDGYSQFLAYRPWFISGTGSVGDSYQRGGFVGDSGRLPEDALYKEVRGGFYIHRGAKNHFGVYTTTGGSRTDDALGMKQVELRYIDSFNLSALGQSGSRTYETDDVILILTQADDLPHYYDASMNHSLRYPPEYPQGVSGAEEGPGLAVELLCKIPGSTYETPTEPSEAVEEIV